MNDSLQLNVCGFTVIFKAIKFVNVILPIHEIAMCANFLNHLLSPKTEANEQRQTGERARKNEPKFIDSRGNPVARYNTFASRMHEQFSY